MSDPFLIASQLHLRFFDETTDADSVLRWWNHPSCWSHLSDVTLPATCVESVPVLEPRHSLRFSIVLNESNLHIGLLCLRDLVPFQRRAELFVLVHPDWRRRGMGSVAAALALRHAFDRLSLDLVTGRLDEGHEVGLHFAACLGFEKMTVLPGWNLRGGRRRDELIFAISRERMTQLRAGKHNPWSN